MRTALRMLESMKQWSLAFDEALDEECGCAHQIQNIDNTAWLISSKAPDPIL